MNSEIDLDAVLQEFGSNYKGENIDQQILHFTDFQFTSKENTILRLDDLFDKISNCFLSGMLVCQTNSTKRRHITVEIDKIFCDRGFGDGTDTAGIWASSPNNDVRYKLIDQSKSNDGAELSLLSLLTSSVGLERYTSQRLDGKPCLHMTDFALTDMLDSAQTLILPAGNSKRLCLRGTVLLPTCAEQPGGGTPNPLPLPLLPSRLPLQTYVQARYAVDLGDDPFQVQPVFCVQDCHGTWVRLSGPAHPDYASDHAATEARTVHCLDSYSWSSEPVERREDGEAEVWRRVTDFHLTTLRGEPHHLEIGSGTEEAEGMGGFALWGILCPPPGSLSPELSIRLRVTQHSVDVGRALYDPQKGVWMQDLRGDWCRLGEPAPAYAAIARTLLGKARELLLLTDALLFQDHSAAISTYLPALRLYRSEWPVKALHKQAHPKFSLHFVMTNRAFVLQHLAGLFDLQASPLLVSSINSLHGKR